MRNKWIMSVAVVLALTFPCLGGGLVSSQGFGINSNNGAGLVGGGLATSSNLQVVNELQQSSDRTGLIRTVQAELGALGQGAQIGAINGYFGVAQNGSVNAGQTQLHPGGTSGKSLGTQYQGMGVDLDQAVNGSKNGQGLAVGLQAMVGVQVQLIATPWGVNVNLQPVMASVYDAVGQGQ